jgi:hypothetical protein
VSQLATRDYTDATSDRDDISPQPSERALAALPTFALAQRDEWERLPERDRRLLTPEVVARLTRGLDVDEYTLADLVRLERQRRQTLETLRVGNELTDTEFRMLRFLQRNEGRTMTYLQIARYLWGSGPNGVKARQLVTHYGYQAPMIVQMHNLAWSIRRKLEIDPLRPQHLCNVRGVGYRWYPRPPSINDGEDYERRAVESDTLREQVQRELGIVEGEYIAEARDGQQYFTRVQPGPEHPDHPYGELPGGTEE